MLPVPMASSPPRCAQHGLALADDGLCVRCRSGAARHEPQRRSRDGAPIAAAAFLALLVAGGAVAAWARHATLARPKAAVAQDVSITMYGAKWCGACKAAHAWLKQHDYAFREIDIEADPANPARAAAALHLTGGGQFGIPVIQVHDLAMQGFDPDLLPGLIATGRRHAREGRPVATH